MWSYTDEFKKVLLMSKIIINIVHVKVGVALHSKRKKTVILDYYVAYLLTIIIYESC